jgi:hypothetical protein
VILRGLGDNNTRGIEGGELGQLFDDGDRVHDDRYGGDGLYTNKLPVKVKKTDLAVYQEFYVSLMGQTLSFTVNISGAL